MAKNTLTLFITADGKRALDTLKATDANLRKAGDAALDLEQKLKRGEQVNYSMAEAFRFLNDLVNRSVIAAKQLNPEINVNEEAMKKWGIAIDSVARKGGAFGSDVLEYLKMQYASVNEQVKESIKLEGGAKAVDNTSKGLERVSRATNNLAKNTKSASSYWSKMFDTTKNALQFRWIMNITKSIGKLKDFLKESTKAAAEAEQVYSKLNTVFGKTSNAMSRTISLANKLGTATSTAASALSTVGDLLQAQGQTTTQSLETASEWVSKFQDIIAFKDIDMSLEEFAQNFMSGAAGNLRNFRTFGSIVRESAVNAELAKKGLDKLTGSELELAKMTARAEMALEQQKNAIGATQREWDTMLSINRRYEESLKSLKENTGDYLEPMTKWWVTLKTTIIDAMNAQMEYDKMAGIMRSGTRLESSNSILNEDLSFNIENWNSFVKELEEINWNAKQPAKRMNNVIAASGKYGATEEYVKLALETANKSYGVNYTENEIQKIIDELVLINGRIEKNEEAKKKRSESEIYLNDINSYLERLQEIKVGGTTVNFTDSNWYKDFYKNFDAFFSNSNVGNIFKEDLDNKDLFIWFKNSIEDSIDDIENSTIPELDKIFGEMTKIDLWKEQKDALKTLYQIAYQTGYFTDKELEEIYNKWEEIDAKIDKTKQKEEIQEQIDDLWISLSDSFQKAMAPLEAIWDGFMGSIKGSINGIKNSEGFFGKLWGGVSGAVSGGIGGMSGSSSISSILLNILSKTEAFQKILSLVDDYIVPVFDQFLKPLLPIIDYFGKILQNTLLSFLEWFWPIMQGVSVALTYIMGALDAVSQLISDSIKSLIGNIVVAIYKAIDKIPGVKVSAPSWAKNWANIDAWDNFLNNLESIEDEVKKIEENTLTLNSNVEKLDTETKDYDVYAKLLAAREISDEQYAKFTGMDKYTTKNLANGVTYAQGNKSYVNVNNLTVQVPEGMSLVDFLKGIEDYNNGHSLYGANAMVS